MATQSWSIWLFIIPVLVSVTSLVVAVLIYRSAKVLVERSDHDMETLRKQIGVATQGAIGMGQRLLALESKLRALQVKQDEVIGGDNFAYSQAMQMFQQGADVSTVASNCGFSNSEAELMALVQKQLAKSARTSRDSKV